MVFLVIRHPESLEGPNVTGTNYIRNGLELVYFFTNSIVALFAIIALGTATAQIEHSQLARTATVYSDVMKIWNSEEVVRSRKLLKGLSATYNDNKVELCARGISSPEDYVCCVLFHFRDTRDPILTSYTEIIDVLEYVGLLCRRGYVEKRDLYEFFAGEIVAFMDLLRAYLSRVRENAYAAKVYPYPDAIFANALWLSDEVGGFVPFHFQLKAPKPNIPWYLRVPLN